MSDDSTPMIAPKVSEALVQFENQKKAKKTAKEGYQELRKFVRWSGDRQVSKFTPHDMEQYAREVGQGGADSAQQRLQPLKPSWTTGRSRVGPTSGLRPTYVLRGARPPAQAGQRDGR